MKVLFSFLSCLLFSEIDKVCGCFRRQVSLAAGHVEMGVWERRNVVGVFSGRVP